jgi:hypothetical protein
VILGGGKKPGDPINSKIGDYPLAIGEGIVVIAEIEDIGGDFLHVDLLQLRRRPFSLGINFFFGTVLHCETLPGIGLK